MGYIAIQEHKLLQDLWGHRGVHITAGGSLTSAGFYARGANYMTYKKQPRRIDDTNLAFTVHTLNIGRTMSWRGDGTQVPDKVPEIYNETLESKNVQVFLPEQVVSEATKDINLVSGANMMRVVNALDPVRPINSLRESTEPLTDVVSFENMCLDNAHMHNDVIALTDKYSKKYSDVKYNRVSECIRELYSITRSVTRMLNMHNIKYSAYDCIDIHTESLALLTGHTPHLTQLAKIKNDVKNKLAELSGEGITEEDLDIARFDKPQYNVDAIIRARAIPRKEGEDWTWVDKPFNFHHCITKDFNTVLNSLFKLPNTSRAKVLKGLKTPVDIVCTSFDFQYEGDTDYLLRIVNENNPTTVRAVQDEVRSIYGNNDNMFSPSNFILGSSIEVKSSITGNTIRFPGLPVYMRAFMVHSTPMSNGFTQALFNMSNDTEVSDLGLLRLFIESTGLSSDDSSIFDCIMFALITINIARLSPSEEDLIRIILSWNSKLMSSFPYQPLGSRVTPSNLAHAVDNIHLQALLVNLDESNGCKSIESTPAISLLSSQIQIRLIRRFLAFMLKTLRKNKDVYANDEYLRSRVWRFVSTIAHYINVKHFNTMRNLGTSKNVSLILHAKYTMHSMLPTQIEDTLVKCNSLYAHTTLMANISKLKRRLSGALGSYGDVEDHYAGIRYAELAEDPSFKNTPPIIAGLTWKDVNEVLSDGTNITLLERYNENKLKIINKEVAK